MKGRKEKGSGIGVTGVIGVTATPSEEGNCTTGPHACSWRGGAFRGGRPGRRRGTPGAPTRLGTSRRHDPFPGLLPFGLVTPLAEGVTT